MTGMTYALKTMLCLLISAIMLCSAAAWAKEKKADESEVKMPVEDSLLHIREEAEVGTDGKFMSLLGSMGQKNDLQAPLRLRTFIESLPVAKMGMGVGYFHSIRRSSLLWATGECLVTGRREQVYQLLLNAVKATGMKESPGRNEAAPIISYTLEESGLIYSLSFMKPEDVMIDGRSYSKTKITCKVEDSNVSSPQTLGRVLTAFPFLRDRRIDDAVYKEMAAVEVEMISLGGAVIRSYEWEAVFIPPEKPDKKNKTTLMSQVEAMLEKLGFAKEAASQAAETFTRKATGSAAYVNKVAGSEKVHIRIRPEQ